ncbi:MAG TPA: hypothetical protein VMT54_21100 [Candidatus Cybelea sp.]|nr:hypothetical protein [Candidatus Cybelea sp.]
MADLAQILLPPPPQHLPVRRGYELALGADPATADDGRARRFRFRVYQGGESGNTNTNYDARRAGTAQGATGNDAVTQSGSAASSNAANRLTAGITSFGNGASSAFLAQSIAQEQLGQGLHNPPNAAANTAYRTAAAALTPPPSAGVNLSA